MNTTDTQQKKVMQNPRQLKKQKNSSLLKKIVASLKSRLRLYFMPLCNTVNSLFTDSARTYLTKGCFTLFCALVCLCAIPGGLYPFGNALVTALTGTNSYFAFAGAAISSMFLGTGALLQLITYIMLFFVRKSVTNGKFDEKPTVRAIESICACLFNTMVKLSASHSFDAVFSGLVFIICSVVCSLLFNCAFNKQNKFVSSGIYALSLMTLFACAVGGVSRFDFSGISLSLIFACLFACLFARANGLIYGGTAGLILGFSCGSPLYSVSLGIASVVSSAALFSPVTQGIIFCIVSTGICIYLSDLSTLSAVFPEIFTACVVFVPLSSVCLKSFKIQKDASIPKTRQSFSKTEFEKVSDTLSGLSLVFSKLSEHLKSPGFSETRALIEDAFFESCSACSMSGSCYARRQCVGEDFYKKCISTLKSEYLETQKFSEMLQNKCIHSNDICAEINKEYSLLSFNYLRADRTRGLVGQYTAFSHLIKTTEQTQKDKDERDMRIEKVLSNALDKLSVPYSSVFVYGKRKCHAEIHGIQADKIPCSASELSAFLSRETGILFCEPSFDISNRADMIMRLTKTKSISLEYAKSSSQKEGEEVNGDTASFFDTESDYFYSLICDGMGNGENAAAASRLSSVFLEKMLSCSAKKNVTLELLNNLLLSKNDETFSTVDLLEIDTLNSSACFVKAGAAPSFVLRGTKLYKIASNTPPAGIIRSFCAESTTFPLEKDDVIIMVSDGVIQSGDDSLWLSEIVRIDTKDSTASLCAQIAQKAKVKNMRSDDISVCVVRVK